MKQEKRCTACGAELKFLKREKVQLGEQSLLIGTWPNFWAGALPTEIWACPDCGKVEFYLAQQEDAGSGIAQRKCPACGAKYDMDYPKCPNCGQKNTAW